MEYQVENTVRLRTQSPHPNLYSWFLEEADASGKVLGPEYVPWDYSLSFEVRNFRLIKGVTIGEDRQNKGADVIRADLFPDLTDRRGTRSYSFFGTNRQVGHFTIRVVKSDKEACHVFGTISYESEWDFQTSISGDVVDLTVELPAERYEELAKFVHDGHTKGTVTLDRVNGFYSGWSPSIRTTHIKILSSIKDQRVQLEDGSTNAPPMIGKVGVFNIEFEKRNVAEAVVSLPDTSNEVVDEERPADPQLLDQLKAGLAALERKVSRLATPLWIAVAALVAILLTRH